MLLPLWALPVFAQYFLRGEIKTAQGKPVVYANIRLASKGSALYSSGTSGTFGIPLSKKQDTITISLDGYETLTKLVLVSAFQSLQMKEIDHNPVVTGNGGLNSLTKSVATGRATATVAYGDETYTSLAENDFEKAADVAETSLSLNINSASYSNIRRFINQSSQVPPDGVRIEEMLNYFNLNKGVADNNNSFRIATQLTTCPWNAASQLLFINIHAPKVSLANAPPAKFIFLIDISGSMDKDNRLPLVQSAFRFLVNNLRKEDTVGIVTYGGYVGVALEPTSALEKQKIDSVISSLRADGDTPGSQAIQTAYDLAEKIYDPKSNNRVILATDGDFNVGQTSDQELENIVSAHKDRGIYLTCLGTGMGNYKDSRLEMLAKKANGNFAYIDNIQEAQKTMVSEFTKNMYTVANNAILRVHFNDTLVRRYRLIGYDNRKDALAKGALEDGGELGSGQSTMAVFEIERNTLMNDKIAAIQLQYRNPKTGVLQIVESSAPGNCISFESADASLRMASAICLFGGLLKSSKYVPATGWETAAQLAANACDKGDVTQRELAELIAKAKVIYTTVPSEKKKKKETY